MFELSLAGCVGSFKSGEPAIFQLQLAKMQDAVPLARNYLYELAEAVRARCCRRRLPTDPFFSQLEP